MKKLFLIPLLACFACVTAWAVEDVSSASVLQDKINAKSAGQAVEIRLAGPITATQPIVIDGGQIVTLDMNNYSITNETTGCIFLLKGKLSIIGEGAITRSGNIYQAETNNSLARLTDKAPRHSAIVVLGAADIADVNLFDPAVDPDGENPYYSTLEVGEKVTISSPSRGIYVDNDRASDINTCLTAMGYATKGTSSASYGVVVKVAGTVEGKLYGVQLSGNVIAKPDQNADNSKYPHFYIAPTATISSAEGPIKMPDNKVKFASGIYAAGWGIWEVHGTVSGNNAVYVNSGSIVLEDAQLTAIGDFYEAISHNSALAQELAGLSTAGSGPTGGGNAISIISTPDADNSYAGAMSITITGDTKVVSESGNAISEKIVVGDNGELSALHIESGTFIAQGDKPAVRVEDATKNSGNVIVSGGNYSDTSVQSLLNPGSIITESSANNQNVFVVGQLPGEQTESDMVHDFADVTAEKTCVDINDESPDVSSIEGNVTIDYLRIDGYNDVEDKPKDVIVRDGAVLSVDEVVLGYAGRLIVEAGGKLIVRGNKGIVVPSADQFIIEATAAKQGIFVFSHEVKSNKTPLATVQYAAHCGRRASDNQVIWDIFTSPFSSISSIDSDPSYFRHNVGGYWVSTNRNAVIADTKAFEPIAMSTNTAEGDYVYIMKGQLQGNMSGIFRLYPGFNYIGNGYMGMLNVQALLQALRASGSVRSGYYIYNPATDNYTPFTELDAEGDNLPPMKMIVLYADEGNDVDLNYGDLIWEINK